MEFIDAMNNVLIHIVRVSILLFEYMGTLVLIISGIKGVINYFNQDSDFRLKLAQGMAMGLEFKLGGEILRTVVIKELSELYIIGGIIVLRAAITFLIHWEIQGEAPKREGIDAGGRHNPVNK